MEHENYIDDFKNSIVLENKKTLFIEVINQNNSALNTLSNKHKPFEIDNGINIFKFDTFTIDKQNNENVIKEVYTLTIDGIQMPIYKIKFISKVDQLGKIVGTYKNEVGGLGKEVAQLQKKAMAKTKTQTKTQTKPKTQTKNIKPK